MNNKIQIRQVTVEAFRGFIKRQSTPLLPLNGLVGIRGFNRSTGGSSGAGKSSIPYAIAYALGLVSKAAAQQNKFTQTPMQVELLFDSAQGPVVLKRGAITSIKVGDEDEISGSVKKVNERLERLFGIPLDLLGPLTYRKQGERGLFLSMTDSEKKEFLSKLLGLEEIEVKIKESGDRIKVLQIDLQKASTKKIVLESQLVEPATPVLKNITEIEHGLADTEQSLAAYNAAWEHAKDEVSKTAEEFKRGLLETETKWKTKLIAFDAEPLQIPLEPKVTSPKLTDLENKYLLCADQVRTLQQEATDQQKELDGKIFDLYQALDEHKAIADRRLTFSTKLFALEAKLKSALESRCSSCEQVWIADVDMVSGLEAEIKQLKEVKIASCDKADSAIITINEKIEDLRAQKLYVNPEIEQYRALGNKLQKEIAEESSKLKAAKASYDAEVRALRTEHQQKRAQLLLEQANELGTLKAAMRAALEPLEVKAKEYETLVRQHVQMKSDMAKELSFAKELNTRAQAQYETSVRQQESLKKSIAEADREVKRIEAEINTETDFTQALKTFMGSVFDEVLDQISREANELLKSYPNVATTTIMFTSERTTTSGNMKSEIRAVINKGGAVFDLKENLSGGQATSVELAVDLAVGKVIRERTGTGPAWTIFDESFEGHDVPVKEACLEVLKKAAQDRLILVVDHASEVKEYFDHFVDVESVDDVSRILEN